MGDIESIEDAGNASSEEESVGKGTDTIEDEITSTGRSVKTPESSEFDFVP